MKRIAAAVMIALVLAGCAAKAPPVNQGQILEQSEAAFVNRGLQSGVDEITVRSDGTVIVTLSMMKDEFRSKKETFETAAGAASIVFLGAPDVQKVVVQDYDHSIIDFYDRPE